MKIESKDFKIKNIFSRRKYIIPDYQRNYSWTVVEEISIFWDDFMYYMSNGPKSNFFIGPMVFKGDDINSSEFEVIDGQQRLITFSILISVVISLLEKYKRPDLSDGLKQYLIYKDEKNNEQLVINTIEPHPFFQKRIFHAKKDAKPIKVSEKLIEKARIFFDGSIEDMLKNIPKNNKKIEYLEEIRDAIFDIDTVIIVSDNETDAFTIFETINTRGKNLSSLDLLKNYVFKNYKNKTGVHEPKETWKKITENIKIAGETFFNRFWASWVAKVSENKLYRRFSDHMRDSEKNKEFPNTRILLNELLAASEIYRKITSPMLDDWKENKNFQIYCNIKNINGLFNLKVHFPFLLALFEEFDKKTIKVELLKETLILMENFHFIFTHIVSPRASGLDNKYSKFAIRIRKEKDKTKVIKDLRKELSEKIPTIKEYAEKFSKLSYKDNKDTIKFVLLKLEKEIDPSLNIDFELHSIDHLEPKSSNIEDRDNIGNLFLLEQKYNEIKGKLKPLDNISKTEKAIEFLERETKYKTTKNEFNRIKNIGKWTKNEINDRTKELTRRTYKLFSKL